MSFRTRSIITIGLIALAVVAECLLWPRTQQNVVSFTTASATTTEIAASTATSSVNTANSNEQKEAYGFATVDGITYEIATSTAKQQLGLGNRPSIPDNYAMLFVFNKDDRYGFWMKDMLAPLDMIWLSDTGTIVSITHNALPASYPNVFYPPVPIRYVLETRVGLADEKEWQVGTQIQLPLPYGENVSK